MPNFGLGTSERLLKNNVENSEGAILGNILSNIIEGVQTNRDRQKLEKKNALSTFFQLRDKGVSPMEAASIVQGSFGIDSVPSLTLKNLQSNFEEQENLAKIDKEIERKSREAEIDASKALAEFRRNSGGRSFGFFPSQQQEFSFTEEQEKLISDNMKAYNRSRDEVIAALKSKGLL